jgi:hypothetical protein
VSREAPVGWRGFVPRAGDRSLRPARPVAHRSQAVERGRPSGARGRRGAGPSQPW